MGYSSFILLSISTTLLLFLSLFHISNSAFPQLCHDKERSALLQFKDSFLIDPQASNSDPLAYPKVESWTRRGENSSGCCLWDGVECDDGTGHVIGLDLSSSCLYGSIDSNSSLFRLVHLRKLNLAFNHFNYSLIPSSFGHLSELQYLNLSTSFFSGQIPSNVSGLSKLSSLDFSWNEDLVLRKPDFKSLIQNLTSLEFLHLNLVDISSTVPAAMLENSSSLVSLELRDCGLYGKFPSRILLLPKLEILRLSSNSNLNGRIPEIHSSSLLRQLLLAFTSFSGELPATIGNFNSLTYLDVSGCKFSGQFPSSLRNMTQLEIMRLDHNPFNAQTTSSLSWLGQLTKLTTLTLTSVNLHGEIPSSLANLTQLSYLYLSSNRLNGSIPSWLMNQTRLVDLALSWNRLLQGPIPTSISNLENLKVLRLGYNNLSGTVEADLFLKLSKLIELDISNNSLSLLVNASSNASSGNFYFIALSQCNLSVFPDFLRHQHKLLYLELSYNNIRGQMPNWLLNLSDNLKALDLTGNLLTGEISPSFCKLKSLHVFRAASNNLSGMLPSCLGDFSTLELLDLGKNNFHGTIPQTYTRRCNLRMIAFDHNRLSGEVPRSLANCSSLEFLNLGSNRISGVFPSWLGVLSNLKVLILSSNKLHGVLEGHRSMVEFQNLHVIDLSQNNFSGRLPTQYLSKWKGMKTVKANEATYMLTTVSTTVPEGYNLSVFYWYTMLITNKGIQLNYNQILELFAAIDLSCNRFEGGIPEVIGELKGLHLLNLSNNILTGPIPPSFGDLTDLEALDLSQNQLSGGIPQELAQLNFLSAFNVSHNHLSGPVPQGKQFDTFLNDSYEGNPSLCGKTLPRKCAKLEALPRASSSSGGDEDSDSLFGFGWKPVVVGYGCGLIIGLVIGHVVFKRKYDWFMKTLRIRTFKHALRVRPQRMRKSDQQRRGHRN